MEKAGVWIFLITACVNPGEPLCFYKSPLINVNVSPVLLNQVKVVLCDTMSIRYLYCRHQYQNRYFEPVEAAVI